MRRLLPVLIALIALAAGVGAGFMLRPPPPEPVAAEAGATPSPPAATTPPADTTVLRLPNQFLVPLIGEGRVRAMVVVGIALELLPEHGIEMQRDEPRLRAAFLQILFDYANLGGFDGVFTSGEQLLTLRRTLLEAATAEFGTAVHDVLVVDLVRQES
jgi:hypothetical protein